jgi:predicted deacetylase
MFSFSDLNTFSEYQSDPVRRPAATMAPSPAGQAFCLVLHGVTPATWPLHRAFVERIDALGGIPATLLVSPETREGASLAHDLRFSAAMDRRLIRGDELVMHGFGHHLAPAGGEERPGRSANSRGWRHLTSPRPRSEREARNWLGAGLHQFLELDWPVEGFVAPGWCLDENLRAALDSLPFRYTADRDRLIRLIDNRSLHAPAATGSDLGAPWRTALSSRRNWSSAVHFDAAHCLRLAVHPKDLQHPEGQDFWLRTVNHLLTQRHPVTLTDWLKQTEVLMR